MRRIPSESSIEGSTDWCCLREFNVSLDQAQQMTHKRRSSGYPSDRPPDLSPNVFLRHVLATASISKWSTLHIIAPHIKASPTTRGFSSFCVLRNSDLPVQITVLAAPRTNRVKTRNPYDLINIPPNKAAITTRLAKMRGMRRQL